MVPAEKGHLPRNYHGLPNPLEELQDGLSMRSVLRHTLTAAKYYNHMPAFRLQQKLPSSIWEEYTKFCVERNPWDKVVSYYYMQKARLGCSFLQFVKNCSSSLPTDYHLYTSAEGQLMVDHVIQYSMLEEELGALFSKLGIPFEQGLRVQSKSSARKRDYREEYDEESKSIVSREFGNEISAFNYLFD